MEVNELKEKNSFFDEMCVNPMNMPLQVLMHQVLHMEKQYMNRLMQPIDLKHGQAAILFVLWKKGPVSQRELADMMKLKPPSITAALQKLEKRKFIERTPDEKDQRVLRIRITDEGKKCLLSMRDIDKTVKNQLFQNITAEELMLVRRLFIQMRENMLEVETLEHPPIS